ncbi:lysylphosphatidylglycerol synthase domain-containing protein [Breznakiellaceae bacterium SP9]
MIRTRRQNRESVIFSTILYSSVAFLTVCFFWRLITQIDRGKVSFDARAIPAVLAFFVIMHILKLFRYYFLILDTRLSFTTFITIYLYTTIIGVLFPFKSGEVFRLYFIGKKCGSFTIAFLSMATERFYDILTIVLILFALFFVYGIELSFTFLVFAFLAAVLFCIYKMFPGMNTCANKYMMQKRGKNYDVGLLKILEKMQIIYQYQLKIIEEKGWIVLFLSIFIWIANAVLLFFVSKLIARPFNLSFFTNFITNIFAIQNQTLFDKFYIMIHVVLAFAMGIGCKLFGRIWR